MEKDGGDPGRFRGLVESFVERLSGVRIVRELPRSPLGQEFVDRPDDPEGGGRPVVKTKSLHRLAVVGHRPGRDFSKRRAGRSGQPAIAVAAGHRGDAADQVPERVGEIRVVTRLETVPGEVTVLSVLDFADQEESERVGAEVVARFERVHCRSERLAHPLSLEVHEAMPEDLPGDGKPGRHQHGRPDHGVEAGDVLAHDVEVGGPALLPAFLVGPVTGCREIVHERVEPDVHHAGVVERHRDPPAGARPADRKIEEPRFEDVRQLVPPGLGLDEARLVPVELEQPVAVRREAEEVVLLGDPVRLCPVEGAGAVFKILLLFEGLTGDAVPALVRSLVDAAPRANRLEQLLDPQVVPLLGGADELVVGDVELRPDRAEGVLHLGAVVERIEALFFSLPAHVEGVLVGPHQEVGVVPRAPLEARDHVGGDLLVGRPEVRRRVDVVDGGGQVETGHGAAGILRAEREGNAGLQTGTATRTPAKPRIAAGTSDVLTLSARYGINTDIRHE